MKIDPQHPAFEAVGNLLAKVEGSRIELDESAGDTGATFSVRLINSLGEHCLHCFVRSRIQPTELPSIVPTLEGSGCLQQGTPPIMVSPYVSGPSAEACRDLGLSWADFAGNGQISAPGLYVHIQGLPNPHHVHRAPKSVFTPKASRVVHAMLLDVGWPWTTAELAEAAGVSIGQVSTVKKALNDQGWIEARHGGSRMVEPRQVLEEWASQYKPRREARHYFSVDDPLDFEDKLGRVEPDAAFAEFSAAARYGHHVRHQRVAFYVPSWSEERARALGLSPSGTANVSVYVTPEPLRFAKCVDGAQCASPIQAYLDLVALGGRGRDAAEHLLETVILPKWA